IQVLSLYHVGVCYICCDNFLCIMNLHVAGQFRILQYRFRNLHTLQLKDEEHERPTTGSFYSAQKYYNSFKICIQQHQALTTFCAGLESVFSEIVLAQVLTFSMLICLVGYHLVLAESSSTSHVIFVNLLSSTMCQLFMFTYSCDCLIRESTNVCSEAFASPWSELPIDRYGKMLRKDLQFVIMRSKRSCCLTANRFFPVSLQTYTSILSTSMSYFTLLKQNSDDTTNT
ncbi:PREDICTED: odorant receptor 13a-like, partial [Dufourea novaeangliae]|uniref:odorant receptor 13a-like n=1 Tax=Dufourea novaeangliae TaxID=178035 RepID=UPI000767804E